jgi:hypothetical protein
MKPPKIGDADFARLGGIAKATAQLSAQQAMIAGVLEEWGGLPPLDSPENAKRTLELILRLTVEAQVLDGPRGNAATKTVETWLRAYDLRQLQLELTQLRAKVAKLTADLEKAKRGG